MSIRTFNGQWLLAGTGIATNDDCCCDQEQTQAPCSECPDDCVCLVLQGHNFCDAANKYVTDCPDPPWPYGSPENCTQEEWFGGPDSGFYRRTEWQAYDPSIFSVPFASFLVSVPPPPGTCDGVSWAGLPYLHSSIRENSTAPPAVKDRLRAYETAVLRGPDGCPVGIYVGGYSEESVAPFPQSPLTPVTPVVAYAQCPPAEFFALSVGPGTELKALLATFGIKASPTCKCNKMARQMDSWGPEESLKHIEEIVDVMQETARSRKLPFLRLVGRKLVRVACNRARKKSAQTGQ